MIGFEMAAEMDVVTFKKLLMDDFVENLKEKNV